MSNLLEQASLVMIPSGYKEDVVYSEIPIDGAGDMSFTRASNGTRINSQGVVEVCPWNFLEQSETFDSGTWSKTGVTVTANTTTAPNGTTTADTLVFGASSNEIVQSVGNLVVNETYTLTIYLRVASGTATMYWGNIDYTTPTITVTTEWQRFTVTQQAAATTRYPKLVSSSAMTVFAWGAQLNIGSTAKPYFPTTDRLNVPRLTYQNGGGGCPSLLLEKQSTNLITYSEDISNSFATKFQVTITSNNTTSPDGTQNADLLKFDSTNSYILRNQTVNASTAYTMSVFVKNNNFTSGQNLTFNMSDGVVGGLTAQINVVAKTATFSGAIGAWTSVSGKVEDYGNGWFRVSVTGTSVGGGGGWYEMAAAGITNSCFVWGFSLEASSYPTSYIPTTSSSATRVADLSTSDTIQTAQTFAGDFTFFVDFVSFTTTDALGPTNQMIIGGGNQSLGATYKSYFWITQGSIQLTGDSETSIIVATKTFTANQRYKLLVKRNGTTVKIFCDGVQVGSSATSSLSITIRSIGWAYSNNYRFNGLINQVVLSATGFSDADCQSLTTI